MVLVQFLHILEGNGYRNRTIVDYVSDTDERMHRLLNFILSKEF